MTAPGRNDPCPCGSGKKYKRCHGAEAGPQRAAPAGKKSAVDFYNQANALIAAGEIAPAEAAYRQAIALTPKFPEAWQNLGVSLQAQHRSADAIACFRRAIELRQGFTDAHLNLGLALQETGDAVAAATELREALRLEPGNAKAAFSLGLALEGSGRHEDAIVAYREAIRLDAGSAVAHFGLGNALKKTDNLEAAAAAFQGAIRRDPRHAESWFNLGNLDFDAGRFAEAVIGYREAIRLRPDYVEAHLNNSGALLVQGQLEEGWAEGEWRYHPKRADSVRLRDFPYPRWDGSPLSGKTILLHAEQGIGDEIMYASVIGDVMRAVGSSGHVAIECATKLESLIRRSFPEASIHALDRRNADAWLASPTDWVRGRAVDWQLPFASLPLYFRRRIEEFPKHHGYLVPDSQRVAYWRGRLAALGPGLKVGIGWRSRPVVGTENHEYCTRLLDWAPLFRVPGIRWVNLQYDDCTEEIAAVRAQLGVDIANFPDVDLTDDLDAAAALTAACDLVISVETAVPMMAGALGVPVWQLSLKNNWHKLGTNTYPWFPTMRVFERDVHEKWDIIFDSVARALIEAADGGHSR